MTTREEQRRRAEIAADALRGSCQTLAQVADQHGWTEEEDDTDFCERLDQLVFCCEDCGWWCDTDELVNDTLAGQICEDCAEELEEYDEE